MNNNLMSRLKTTYGVALVLALLLVLPGCQTLREVANLRKVNFSIDRVAEVQLAGINLSNIRSFEDLGAGDVLRLGAALARKEMPLTFQLHVMAENPADNPVQARLVRMDWTLLLEDRETINGVFDQNVVLPPGQAQDLPFPVSLDLLTFFDKGARDLVELGLALAGQGGAPKEIKLRATPTIDTAIGPIRYPEPITILSREIGTL